MITFEHVSYTYPDAATPTLHDVNLHLPEGSFTLVVGPSGAGKSTLLRCINGLVPHFSGGTLKGDIRVGLHNPVLATPKVMSRYVGFVFQDPEAQFIVDRVEDEVAFALENAGIPCQTMHKRVDEVLDLVHLTPLRNRRLETLSGGEKQRVAIASALALRPRILVLDEPTSQLDPDSADDVLRALTRLKTDLNLTLVLAEHRLERVLPFVDQIVAFSEDSSPVRQGTPREILPTLDLAPPLIKLGQALDWGPLPLTLEEARTLSLPLPQAPSRGVYLATSPPGAPSPVSGRSPSPSCSKPRLGASTSPTPPPLLQAPSRGASPPVIETRNLTVTYQHRLILDAITLTLHSGEILALLGPNGAGKTTLLKSIVGLVKPQNGHVYVAGHSIANLDVAQICRQVGYLPQDPNALLFADTVLDELHITLRNHGLLEKKPNVAALSIARNLLKTCYVTALSVARKHPKSHNVAALSIARSPSLKPDTLLSRLGLSDKASTYPRDLSTGERQRVALGAILITQPRALLLDEPTRGLDYAAKHHLLELLRGWRDDGMGILLVTHDVELAAEAADRVALLHQGQITACGEPVDVLGPSQTFAPQIARLFPGRGWLTVGDVIKNDELRIANSDSEDP